MAFLIYELVMFSPCFSPSSFSLSICSLQESSPLLNQGWSFLLVIIFYLSGACEITVDSMVEVNLWYDSSRSSMSTMLSNFCLRSH